MAFGDSITEGKVETNITIQDTQPENSYPTVLLNLLKTRYTTQQFTMANEGMGGHSAEADNETGLFQAALDRNRPEVLLLMQGVVDLTDEGVDGIDNLTHALRDDIRAAREQQASVFISTITAEKDPLPGYASKHFVPDSVLREANDSIRQMAAEEGATLVDGYAVTAADPAHLIGGDGLHLTVEGYQKLAAAFFDAIKAKLEVPPDVLPAGLPVRTTSGLHVEISPQRPRQPVRIHDRE
jgi:lysophospholipase L1-like esterase